MPHTLHTPLLLSLCSGRTEAGADEAGRGCLAGPVVAAAVVLPPDIDEESLAGLDDSKKLSERQRGILREKVMEVAECWAVGESTAQEIDEINILNAAILAMHRAIAALTVKPQHLLIDGNRFHPFYSDFCGMSSPQTFDETNILHDESTRIGHTCVVGGDGKYMPIAAASVLAKTHRDALMARLAADYPHYGWEINKGYPTKAHYAAIRQYGITPFHRRSFRLDK